MPLKRPADDEDPQDIPGASAKRILAEDQVRPPLNRGDSLPTGNAFIFEISNNKTKIIYCRMTN